MSVSLETLEKLKNELKEVKDLGTPIKADLYSHLTEVFNRIMLHHPNDAYDKFEDISALVKRTNFKISDPKFDVEVNDQAAVISNREALEFIQKVKNLVNEVPDLVEKQDRHMLFRDNNCVLPNYPEQAEMLEWAGIGFGEEMNFLIQKSLKRLAQGSGASSLKLFGKVLGHHNDYWVAQGVLNEQEEDPSNPHQEKRGAGSNATVFWVTHNLMNDWIQLPDVQPEHIQIAKMMVRQLSGNLNAQIDSNPPFPGKERHYLRAQLARIQHATEIIPKGLFELDDESGEQKFAEEFAVPGTDELKSLEVWGHLHPLLLKSGRCTHAAPEGLGDEERDEAVNKLNEEDPTVERFKAIMEDTKVVSQDAWLSKVSGDTQQYNKVGGEGTLSYAVNVIRSMRWPGSVTVAKNGKFCTIYVGDGQKRGDSYFNPTEPPEVQLDPSEPMEQPEPNGKEPVAEKVEGEEAVEEE